MGGAFPARIFWAIPLGVLAFGLTLTSLNFPFVTALRESAFDQYQKFSPRPYQPLPIRVIAIDEASLDAFGQWPWPRRKLAELTERLADLGVAAIGFDLLFAEPDRFSSALLAEELEPLPDLRAELEAASARGALPDNDQLLADAFLLAPSVVGLALSGEGEAPEVKAGFALAGDDPIAFLPHLSASINPLPALRETAAGLGALNVLRESGGILRRLPLLFSVDGVMVPSLALELLRVAQGVPSYVVRASGASGISSFGAQTGVNTIKVGQFQIPTDGSGSLWLYDSGPVTERTISARDILLGSPEDFDLEGFIVIVGVTAAGFGDRHATPLAAGAPGVTLHAQVLEQVLTGAFLTRPDWAPGAELVFVALLSLLILYFYWRRRSSPLVLIAAGTLGVIVAVGGSWILFDHYRLLIDPVTPSLVCVAVYLSASAIRFWQADRERRWVRQAFAHYVEPSVVAILANDPKRLKLGGERKELTLLFCDLRGFTALSEKLPVEETTEVINRFLTAMGDAVLKNHGTIDKYMGDCVMAFWNAPLDDPAHARNACLAALGMRQAMEGLRQDFPDLQMGIGINTGICSVGNMGSDRRFDYSALGDAVNLASRLQGATKTVGVDILISKATKDQAGDFPFQLVGELELRGHLEKITAFTLPRVGTAEKV